MNKIKSIKCLLTIACASMLATGCIEETLPENGTATQEQLGASSNALESTLNGIPTQMTQWYFVYGEQDHETDMAYLMFPILQTELMGDMFTGEGANTGYDWFSNYNNFARNFGEQSYMAYLPWFTLYKLVKGCNDVIGAVPNPEEASDDIKQVLGSAYTYRALDYFTLMYLWEPATNKYTDVSAVKGLTVPIVSESTTREEAMNNPRVSHAEMIKFILSDLDKAERFITSEPKSKLYPSLACVYGLKARVYMWDAFEKTEEEAKADSCYIKAAQYARLAIDTHAQKPTTEAQWLDVNTGFNTEIQSWMWKMGYSAENMANLCNFTGWMSAEADWGYSSLTMPSIDRSLYDKIAYSDFRKYTFLDPDRTVYDYKSCRDKGEEKWSDDMPNYVSTKFRCKDGDWETYTVGAVVDVPLMRVEEFYFIEAEAVAHTAGVDAGKALLNTFMQKFRQKDYSCKVSNLREFQIEVLTQMRIESWGEGWAFPMAKRIKPGVMQNYEGTNAPADAFKINCEGIKPNWNFVIPKKELDNNAILSKTNNPDPTAAVVGPAPVGVYQ